MLSVGAEMQSTPLNNGSGILLNTSIVHAVPVLSAPHKHSPIC